MLTAEEQGRIAANMCLYEHAWRYPASYLGEPFLLEDILAFFDGSALNVCVFPLGDARQLLADELCDRLALLEPDIAPKLVHVWGNVLPPTEIFISGYTLQCVEKAENHYLGEHSIDLEQPEVLSSEAKKALRSFARDGLRVDIKPSSRLSWRELDLIERWRDRIKPGIAGTVAGASIANYVAAEQCYIARCYHTDYLIGFSVFAKPRPDLAVNLMSFADRLKGIRIEDSLLHATIDECRRTGVCRLHLGYAGTDSLARFKEKWGAIKTGPDYTQAIYATGQSWERRAKDFTFFWWARLIQNAASR